LVQKEFPNTDYLYLHYLVQNDPKMYCFTFLFLGKIHNPITNGWMEMATFIASPWEANRFLKVQGWPNTFRCTTCQAWEHTFQIAIVCRFHKLILENAWGWLRDRTICRHTHFPRQPYHLVKHTSIDSFWESWLNGSSAKYRIVCI